MGKISFKTLKGESEDYYLSDKGDNLLLRDLDGYFQQRIPKVLRWRVLDTITTSLDEAVKRSRVIDGTIKTIYDKMMGDNVSIHLVYGYTPNSMISVKSTEPITIIR